jgi:Protein of unknown function (DUF3800)
VVRVYIDESGSFVQPRRPNRVSAVGALVVPDGQADDLFTAFEELTTPWARDSQEVKGSSLSETQIAGVIELVGQYDALFDVRGIDMGLHDLARITTMQDRQAAAITAEITEDHAADWHEWGALTEGRMRGLSPQLFVQCMLTIHLVIDLLQTATIFYVRWWPKELAHFRWRIDPKDVQRTDLERLWTDVLLPMAQYQSTVEPFATIKGADYRHFRKFYVDRGVLPPDLAQYVGPNPRDGGINLKKIMEDLDFPDSRSETGLRIVDILLSAFCRALNGTLDERGWSMLGRVMTGTQNNRDRLVLLRTDPSEEVPAGRRPYGRIINTIESQRRDVFTPRRRRR